MRIKAIGLATIIALGCLNLSDAHSPDSRVWSVIWFPPNDTFTSWNWAGSGSHQQFNMPIFDPSGHYDPPIKHWALGVLSVDDPDRKVAVPLSNFYSHGYVDFDNWIPGWSFPGEADPRLEQLKSLGEGTFLCAILGDGKRCSNVARVTIRHDYDASREPKIRLVAVQPFGKDDPIKYIGAWIVPSGPRDLDTISVQLPEWEVDGKWISPAVNRNGRVFMLPAHATWGEVYAVGDSMGVLAQPTVQPFKEEKIRLRIQGHPEYTSDVFDLRVDKDAIVRFEKAFRPQ